MLWSDLYGYGWTGMQAWPPGAALQMTGPGTSQFPAFTASVTAVTPLPAWSIAPGQASLDGPIPTVQRSQPLTVTWPGEPDAGVTAWVVLTAIGYGGPSPGGGTLTCSGDDTGSMTIPASTLFYLPAATAAPLGVTVFRMSHGQNPTTFAYSQSQATTQINLQ
jgi:hypothetical protein